MKIDYAKQTYIVNGREGFDLSTALKLWKTKYQDDYRDFKKAVITHESLNDFEEFVSSMWPLIETVTIQDALIQENTEDRRVYFDAIGIEKLFKSLDPKLLDKQTIKKSRTRWDDEFNEYTHEFEDVYELYEIPASKMFTKDRWGNEPRDHIYAVRCWCTTTNREYWLYVPRWAALGESWWSSSEGATKASADAIRAIAWTVRLDVPIGHVDRIYRQGDIIVAKIKTEITEDTMSALPYHLSKEDYLQLMYSET
jgi:hypothetical protein